MLNEIFFEELELRNPDYFLDVDVSSLGSALGDILKKVEEVFIEVKPQAVLILGDTNSSIAAVLAKRMQIPVYHMEAGNRSFDENVPEETNRRLVDHVSDFNIPYSEHARRNLLAEGLSPRRIMLSGSPMREVLNHYLPRVEQSPILESLELKEGKYFLVSAHRQENVDSPQRLASLIDSIKSVRSEWGYPVLVSTHPRTRKQLASIPNYMDLEGVLFHEPFGFFDYIKLQMNSACVLSDSGTISEESIILGFPAVTIRDSMERPEAMDFGGIVMTGLEPSDVLAGVSLAMATRLESGMAGPTGYEVTDCSSRVVKFMLSTMSRHHDWAGIRILS
jgi:UDP-N-acetylglucosamine 2-epimerase (non-hydrolysing)